MKLLLGEKIANSIKLRLKKEVNEKNIKLTLAVVLVGNDYASKVFVAKKEQFCKDIGLNFKLFQFKKDINFEELKKEVNRISLNSSGVVIQLPLPLKEKTQEILNLIPIEKDIDVLSENSLGRFHTGSIGVLPPVVGSINHIFKKYKISLKEKSVLLVGAGRLVGFPLAIWLLKNMATVSVVNKSTKDISSFTKKADIIISGAGKPGLIKGPMIKKGAVVIDAGSGFMQGKIKGDVNFDSVAKKAGYLSPVPGGVGPLTVACLFENLIKLNGF